MQCNIFKMEKADWLQAGHPEGKAINILILWYYFFTRHHEILSCIVAMQKVRGCAIRGFWDQNPLFLSIWRSAALSRLSWGWTNLVRTIPKLKNLRSARPKSQAIWEMRRQKNGIRTIQLFYTTDIEGFFKRQNNKSAFASNEFRFYQINELKRWP